VVRLKSSAGKATAKWQCTETTSIGSIRKASPTRVLKGECKSRAAFGKSTMDEAAASLDRHDGRPNPSTLAFITKTAIRGNRDAEAKVFQALQSEVLSPQIMVSHLILLSPETRKVCPALHSIWSACFQGSIFGLQKQKRVIGPARRFGFLTASRKRL